jgi:hypothetical protein
LRLIKRTFQPDGSMAASVISPSGGAGQRAPHVSQTGAKLQNEFGLNRGNTIRTFGASKFLGIYGLEIAVLGSMLSGPRNR